MGILTRFKDIMSANINSLLTKAEGKNADKLLENYLREAKDNLEQVKAETAGVIADEMACARKVTAHDEEIVKMQNYAEQAVAAGNDGDAVKFLEAKNKAAAAKAEAEQAYAVAKNSSDRMRELTKKLIGDIGEADAKLGELKSKLAVAEQTEKMNELNDRMSQMGSGVSNYDSLVDAVQNRIDEADAKAALNKELSTDTDMESLKAKYTETSADGSNTSVQDELAALKAKLGK